MIEGSPRDLSRVRGWLLLFAVALVPHLVIAIVILTHSGLMDLTVFGWINLVVQLIGGSAGLVLIIARSRVAPAYFTLYIPFLVVLFLLDPDPLATRVAYMEVLGDVVGDPSIVDEAESTFGLGLSGSIVSSALAWGYMQRSKRVKAVFGSTGLGLFRGEGSGQPKSTDLP